MDQRSSQFLYFICKVCQRVFKDKLELYVHQSNEHHQIQYTDDINYDTRTSTTVEVKRPAANNFLLHNQQAASWFPPATGHVPNHVENQNYYTNPEYYVVVPNQSQTNNNGTTMLATTVTANPTMNITVPLVGNSQIAHSSSTSSAAAAAVSAINLIYSAAGGQMNTNSRKVESISDYDGNNYYNLDQQRSSSQTGRIPNRYGQELKNEQPQQQQQQQQHHQQQQQQQQQSSLISHGGNNLVTLRNEIGNEWNKVGGGDSSESAKDDLDYYCWKCKVKFGNATSYISHSSSCLTPLHAVGQEGYESQSPGVDSDSQQQQQQQQRGKRGKKSKSTMQQEQNDAKRRKQFQVGQYHLVDLEEEQRQVQAAAAAVSAGIGGGGGRGRRKTPNVSAPSVTFQVGNNLVANGSVPLLDNNDRPGVVKLENKPAGREDRSFPCTHCGLKLTSNERLTTHLLQCKSRKNPYESYQYKCIKCKESFDVYATYKRHITIHTGEFRYS